MPRPFIPFPGGARVVLTMNYTGTPYVFINVLHVHKGSAFSLADLTALATVISAWDSAYYFDLRSAAFYLYEIRCEALDSETAPHYVITLGSSHPGGIGGAVYSFAFSKSVALRTAFRGRGNQGRVMLPPIPQSVFSSPGTLNTGFTNNAQDTFNTLIIALNAATPPMELVVASYRHDHNWRTAAAYSPVTNCTVHNTRVDTQRRRLNQVGS